MTKLPDNYDQRLSAPQRVQLYQRLTEEDTLRTPPDIVRDRNPDKCTAILHTIMEAFACHELDNSYTETIRVYLDIWLQKLLLSHRYTTQAVKTLSETYPDAIRPFLRWYTIYIYSISITILICYRRNLNSLRKSKNKRKRTDDEKDEPPYSLDWIYIDELGRFFGTRSFSSLCSSYFSYFFPYLGLV